MSEAARADTAQEVEAAIARVLDAERDARDAIARAREEADAIEEAAREAARRIDQRTDRRILRLRAAFERSLASALAALERDGERAQAPDALADTERAAVQAAASGLAAALTGGAPAAGGERAPR